MRFHIVWVMKLSILLPAATIAAVTINAPLAAQAFTTAPVDFQSGVYGQSVKNSITAVVTTGMNLDDGGTSGAYTEFYNNNTVTIDFNQAATEVGTNTYTFGDDRVTFNFTNGMSTSRGTGVYGGRWAPSGAGGEVNTSQSLNIFKNNAVTIGLDGSLNYYGINWGAISAGNDFAFYQGDSLVETFTYNDVNPIAPIRASQHNGEGNGYLHFYATDSSGTFDRIVISQSGGGGFESDNHSFAYGNDAFSPAPVPFEAETSLGLLLLGGFFGYKKLKSRLKTKTIDLTMV